MDGSACKWWPIRRVTKIPTQTNSNVNKSKNAREIQMSTKEATYIGQLPSWRWENCVAAHPSRNFLNSCISSFSFGILISELEPRGGGKFFVAGSAFEMELMIFVIGRGIYGSPFILNMAEKLSPEDDLESSSQWALLMSGWFLLAASASASHIKAAGI